MKIPEISCNIEASCEINPSEDPLKMEHAMSNVIPNAKITISKSSMKATSKDLQSLSKIHEKIHSRKKQKLYRRNLEQNLTNDSTWFYLNKQAAFVDTIALCGESEDSPLGPIKIVLTSNNLEQVTEWFLS